MNRSRKKAVRCPDCDGVLVPIMYGMPGIDTFERAAAGEVILGGCIIMDGQPTWQCLDCSQSWERKPGADPSDRDQ